jgi:hypothetical protein
MLAEILNALVRIISNIFIGSVQTLGLVAGDTFYIFDVVFQTLGNAHPVVSFGGVLLFSVVLFFILKFVKGSIKVILISISVFIILFLLMSLLI